MIVPQFWAEGRAQDRRAGRQVTVRRFGWSDTSAEAAQAMADERTREALACVLGGEKLDRREPKRAYNGAQGVPIREEVLARQGDSVITRNAYGAPCLNTPDVLFVDIDFQREAPLRFMLAVLAALLAASAAGAWLLGSGMVGVVAAVLSLLAFVGVAQCLYRLGLRLRGDAETRARQRVARFAAVRPHWGLDVYRTPAGLRVLATHATFDPRDPEVTACFDALGADPVYVAMCRNQRCFRARLGPKPWRIGIAAHLRPRPGVWPVAPERLPVRSAWIAAYEAAARGHAACRWLESLGSRAVHPAARAVQALHDDWSGARSGRPIA